MVALALRGTYGQACMVVETSVEKTAKKRCVPQSSIVDDLTRYSKYECLFVSTLHRVVCCVFVSVAWYAVQWVKYSALVYVNSQP